MLLLIVKWPASVWGCCSGHREQRSAHRPRSIGTFIFRARLPLTVNSRVGLQLHSLDLRYTPTPRDAVGIPVLHRTQKTRLKTEQLDSPVERNQPTPCARPSDVNV